MKICRTKEKLELESQIETLLMANDIPIGKKDFFLGEQDSLERYKEVLDLLAEIIADDILKRRKADG